ncbi:lamin tail domain-containing protein [Polyangium sp. 15x6]|uniref:lamin tail domain-containing protein n=1 Tax=Polyangium sp. 15x6 TaxID=3042687 RepID=UPI00249B6703|nr:lamin tail domain-containing protein [Polyangium sp. 15x6]MDI3289880.1 lamin tail domain-containing protein [Polyangium sp. 15x6]
MIYEELWDLDQAHEGCRVAARTAEDTWIPEDAHVKLDLQGCASGKRHIDLATRPLFAYVDPTVLQRPTYAAFVTLLDNYIPDPYAPEIETPEEGREIHDFLRTIAQTPVMQRALVYIREELGHALSEASLQEHLRDLWFRTYTNHYGGRVLSDASGFEHVFVGEGRYDPRRDAQALGELSGYHSWIKFYLDESHRRVNYLGYQCGVRHPDPRSAPSSVTLQMLSYYFDLSGTMRAELFKKIGGFFVGTSPAFDLAIGAVAFHESVAGLFEGIRRRIRIHDETYDLVLCRNIREDGSPGDHIRSLYPVFVGDGRADALEEGPVVIRPVGAALRNEGPVVIEEAMPHPDSGTEWIRLRNVSSEEIELSGWALRDRMARSAPLGGTLGAGEDLEVELRRDVDGGMALGNRGGTILLYDRNTLVAAASYGPTRRGEAVRFRP